ncbi:MAG: hypothetical protein R3A44_09365 [Caldilineaceae bacterium]
MTLSEILQDIHACEEDMLMYERKYNILSETFYESYMQGDEPPDDAWVLEWSDWAGAYEIWLDRKERYHKVIQILRQENSLVDVIAKAVRREPLPVAA